MEAPAPAVLAAGAARQEPPTVPGLLAGPLLGMLAVPCGMAAKLHCCWRMASLQGADGGGAACARAAGCGVLARGSAGAHLTLASVCALPAASSDPSAAPSSAKACTVAACTGEAASRSAEAKAGPGCRHVCPASWASSGSLTLLIPLLQGLLTGLPVSTVSSSAASQKE